jgi:hypothetical protein
MLGDFGFQKFSAMRVELQQGAFLIDSHAAATGDVTGQDGRKPSFEPRTGHVSRPDLARYEPSFWAHGGCVYRG